MSSLVETSVIEISPFASLSRNDSVDVRKDSVDVRKDSVYINKFKNEQSAYNQKDGPGVVNGGGDAGGIFVREWTHLRR